MILYHLYIIYVHKNIVALSVAIIWGIVICSLYVNRRFGGT
jgi:hypothetical protein